MQSRAHAPVPRRHAHAHAHVSLARACALVCYRGHNYLYTCATTWSALRVRVLMRVRPACVRARVCASARGSTQVHKCTPWLALALISRCCCSIAASFDSTSDSSSVHWLVCRPHVWTHVYTHCLDCSPASRMPAHRSANVSKHRLLCKLNVFRHVA